ncbi:MAG: FG-GAP repeat domain-containing protein, partial [Verrucomicrobiota bacterium]
MMKAFLWACRALVCIGLACCRAEVLGIPGVKATPLRLGATEPAGLELMSAPALGIDFTNGLRFERLATFQNLMNGTGVAAGDVDGDGLVDLFFAHREGASALYRNLGGWRFTNITQSAGVALTNMTACGALLADITSDGALDLLATSFGGPHAFLVGDGKGHFTDASVAAGIASKTGATSLAVGDLDGDGDLDVYWCNFGTTSPLRDGAELSERMVNGVPTVTGRWAKRVRIIDGRYFELGEPDVLYWNEGNGRLRPAVWAESFVDEDGRPLLEAPPDFGLAVQVRDINGDGHPDIYVCNDFQTPDRMWLGDGKGRFRAAPRHALRTMSYASMGVDFADIDRDGHLDFYTVEMLRREHDRHLRSFPALVPRMRMPGLGVDREDMPRNGLFRNRGDGTWEEIACQAGVAATEWSWAPVFLDVDLDGWEDLLVSNGFRHDVNDRDVGGTATGKRRTSMRGDRSILREYPPINAPKVAYRNRRDLTFEDVSAAWGFDSARPAHGTALADLDGDGDLDVV